MNLGVEVGLTLRPRGSESAGRRAVCRFDWPWEFFPSSGPHAGGKGLAGLCTAEGDWSRWDEGSPAGPGVIRPPLPPSTDRPETGSEA